MAAESIANLVFTGPLTWTERGRMPRRVAAVLRARRRAARGPRRRARRRPVPSAARARRSSTAATGPASTASTASGAASPKKTAPAAGFRVDMPVGRVARYPRGNGQPVAAPPRPQRGKSLRLGTCRGSAALRVDR